ncbi:transposase [Pyxidicoccus fallax]|uniref:Transposase n=1 Tax=Pyxidicoccus fallax TaxID=394095 RepID=A0A848LD74_9BACT|nr:transposase [Pyxidicoccus fallax]NMO14211.1 transposase [Pyxidicoccus fallax]
MPKSPLGEALTYLLNQLTPLERFLEDGRLWLDNNLSENALRHQVVGRKNWLFAGSDEGADWNATFVTMIASCRLHGPGAPGLPARPFLPAAGLAQKPGL